MRLSAFLAAAADRHPDRPAFRDQPAREHWSGRPRLEWSYALATRVVGRLAASLAGLGLKPGSPIGVCLPNGSEAALTILGIEQAGCRPCLLPVAWSEKELEQALEAAGLQAVVTQSMIGEERPADLFCAIAARTFNLRFLCAYGPDVPDGVIDLDRIILSEAEAREAAPEADGADDDPGLITFGMRAGPGRPLHRTGSSLVAAAVAFLVSAQIEPGDRIISLLAPDDLRGLATGLAASLLGGATLECHGIFEGASLVKALEDGAPPHLIAPGWLEPALAESGLCGRLGSTILVHAAPIRFKAKTQLKQRVVDVVAFDELALLARARDPAGRLALTIGDDDAQATPQDLLRVCRDEEGGIWFSGLASEVRPYARHGTPDAPSLPEWRDSGFKADIFAGIVIGVS